MNMFWHELRAYRKSTIIWTFSLIGLAVLFLSFYPAISNDANEFKQLLEGYPETVRKAFGISIDSIASFLGFYSYAFGYILLCASIQAMNVGISIVSREVREKTADFLLTRPVARTQILSAKLAAAFASVLFTHLVYAVAASMAASLIVKEFNLAIFLMISATAFLVALLFLALGFLLAVIVSRVKSVLPLSLSVVFGFFILGMFGSVLGENAIRYLTPFQYYDAAYIIEHCTYEPEFLLIEAIFLPVAICISYRVYVKQDIHAV